MSREIKFRAWDDKRSFMFPVWDVRWNEKGKLWKLNEGEDFDETVGLMQFTGLLDKNGKEIYEGDILEIETKKAFQDDNDYEHIDTWFTDVGVVKILPSQGVVICKVKRTAIDGHKISEPSKYRPVPQYRAKVVGHIYNTSFIGGEK